MAQPVSERAELYFESWFAPFEGRTGAGRQRQSLVFHLRLSQPLVNSCLKKAIQFVGIIGIADFEAMVTW